MKLKKLSLKLFGPFKNYELNLPDGESVCVLFTGKNNEGKSNIINAIKLLDGATRAINQKKQAIIVDGNTVYKLLQQDTESLNIKRMIHNYEDDIAEIKAIFSDNFEMTVYIDSVDELIYADYSGVIPQKIREIFGFIPALGPLSENEEILSEKHVRTSLNTSLAPRHLRNHFYRLLDEADFDLIREIVNSSWQDIKLLKYEVKHAENKIDCFYTEKNYDREISWAGQGLQVWFQIITHLVRLKNTSILILDEPEINLHPEKQNDLIRILKEYYGGSIIIATHSIEMMNNVKISHIVHVKKNQIKPKIKSTADRANLELIRSQIGSHFNFTASQFEDVDIIIFTEDDDDFKIVSSLAKGYGFNKKAHNIRLHGFSEYKKAEHYKKAYELLIGKNISYSMLLDRDYYPDIYLSGIKEELDKFDIKVFFTIGKEIENIFLFPSLLFNIFPDVYHEELQDELDVICQNQYLDSHGKLLKLYKEFLPGNADITTINKENTPKFNASWNDKTVRHEIVSGKPVISALRDFYRKLTKQNLSDQYLISKLMELNLPEVKKFIEDIYQVKN